MAKKLSMDKAFIKKLTKIIKANLGNEHFGVAELATEVGLSRSQLHRKLQDINGKSTSQFIREYRLQKAMDMLKRKQFTASEIAYRVGFTSPTYFNTCFHNFYGYPPGEVKYQKSINTPKKSISKKLISILPVIILIGLIVYNEAFNKTNTEKANVEKTIAVMPFVNDSPNDENIHFCNGIMAGIRDHLAKVPEFSIASRLSVEKYRKNPPSLKAIGKELGVNYLVEGRVQRIGDQALISAELINVNTNKVIWSERYNEDVSEIFLVQASVIQSITNNLETVISPNLKEELNTNPTQDKFAYEYYLQGEDYRFKANRAFQKHKVWLDLINKAKSSYQLAIKSDSLYTAAYMGLALTALERHITYVDDENNLDEVLHLTNKVLQLNPKHSFAYIIRGNYFRSIDQKDKAIIDYEKSLKIMPNNTSALNSLIFIYVSNNNYKDAVVTLKKLEKYAKTRGDLIRLYNHYINFYRTLNQHNMVDYYFNKTFNLYTTPVFRRDRIYSYIQSKRYDEALIYVNENLHKDNQQKNALLGILYIYKEDFKKGKTYWKKCYNQVEKEGVNSLASRLVYWGYGESLMRTGQIERGEALIKKQIELYEKLLNSKRNIDKLHSYYMLISLYNMLNDAQNVNALIPEFERLNGWVFWNQVDFAKIGLQRPPIKNSNLKEGSESLKAFKASVKRGEKQLEVIQKQIRPYLPSTPPE